MRDAAAVAATPPRWIIINNNNNCPSPTFHWKPMKWLDRRSVHGGFYFYISFKKTGHTHHPVCCCCCCCFLLLLVCYEHVRGSFRFKVGGRGPRADGCLALTVPRNDNSPSTLCGLFLFKNKASLVSLLFFCLFLILFSPSPSPWLRSLVFTLRSAGACGGSYFWKREMSVEKREERDIHLTCLNCA